MKLYEFCRLTEVEQYNAVWNIGRLIDQCFEESVVINLYAINEFFVEVYYDVSSNKILYKKHFKQGELLDKYLNKNKINFE
ncbi:hypothetical protein [Flavobacterium sp. 11]|uniref:hypothetical protein n=1 Tax=Flavobacterium sp. 11 TaxID=357523 RepID=UPI000C5EADC2|nr:hypothetical protein [Flavobacterium sp. 11]PIF61149.1 hypothetical protein CLV00_0707 [Flavobacterium sp. 11]